MPWPGVSPPSGWLLCDGSSFSAATYPLLRDALNATVLPLLQGVYVRSEGVVGLNPTESTRVEGEVQIEAFASIQQFSGNRTLSVVSGASGGHGHASTSVNTGSSSYGSVHASDATGGGSLRHVEADDPRAGGPPISGLIGSSPSTHSHPVSAFTPPSVSVFTHGSGHSFTAANSIQLSDHSHPVSAVVNYSVTTPNQSVESDRLEMNYIIRALPL